MRLLEINEENGHDMHSAEEIFQNVYFMVLFFTALWVVGKISVRLGLPALVGEIVTGIILGPNLLDVAPYSDSLKVIGDIGLLLLVLEAGIDVNMGILKVVGTKGLMIAIFGSLFPLLIGSSLAFAINTTIQPRTAVAIGACFAPTSMGIALNVLRNGHVLNTPTGQLIIAAAVLDDVIALMLLSILQEFSVANPSPVDIVICIVISPILILVFGYIAIKISPAAIKYVMDKIDIKYHEYAILLMLFSSMLILVPACYYSKSSYLLGAFLSGLMFCTDHTIHHVWEKQMKRIMHWMLRIFFACTIGFEVPILDFFTKPKVVIDALVYSVAIIGKLATGIFATSRPITMIEFFTISFSMSAWGEFAFILATSSYASGMITKDSMTSILMAVLFSVIIAPLLLRMTLQIRQKKKLFYAKDTRTKTINSISKAAMDSLTESQQYNNSYNNMSPNKTISDSNAMYLHNVYYCIHTKTYGKWGHQSRLLKSLHTLHLEIIDFRAWNEAQDNRSHHIPYVQDIFYVKDTQLFLMPTKQINIQSKRKLCKRVKYIRNSIKVALQDKDAKISIMRWLPGIKQTDDHDVTADNNILTDKLNHKKLEKKRSRISVSYVRNEAYKEARLALSYSQLLPKKRRISSGNEKNNCNNNMLSSPMPTPRLFRIHSAQDIIHREEQSRAQGISLPPPTYLSRIHSAHDAAFVRRVSISGDVHKEEYDDLVRLKFADETDVEFGDDNSMSLEIIYGDENSNQSQGQTQPQTLEHSHNSMNEIKVMAWNAPKSPNPSTPNTLPITPFTPLLKTKITM